MICQPNVCVPVSMSTYIYSTSDFRSKSNSCNLRAPHFLCKRPQDFNGLWLCTAGGVLHKDRMPNLIKAARPQTLDRWTQRSQRSPQGIPGDQRSLFLSRWCPPVTCLLVYNPHEYYRYNLLINPNVIVLINQLS